MHLPPYSGCMTDEQRKKAEKLSQMNKQKVFFSRINIALMITAYHENCVEKLNLVVVLFAAGFSACAFQRSDFFQPIESVGAVGGDRSAKVM